MLIIRNFLMQLYYDILFSVLLHIMIFIPGKKVFFFFSPYVILQQQQQQLDDLNYHHAKHRTIEQWVNEVEFGKNAMTTFISGASPETWYAKTHIDLLPDRVNHLPNQNYFVTQKHFQFARIHLIGMYYIYKNNIN